MLETMGDRLSKYTDAKMDKKSETICPVCHKFFVNNYSLSNHFLIRGFSDGPHYLDDAHKEYYLNNKKKEKEGRFDSFKNKIYDKKCIRCGETHQVTYEHRFQKRCPECEIKYPVKIKKPTDKTKEGFCSRCNSKMIIKVCSNNQVCPECRRKERVEKIRTILSVPLRVKCLQCGSEFLYYRKHIRDRMSRAMCNICKSDSYPFKKDPKYEKVLYLLEKTELTRREIKNILGLERDFVREAAIEKFGADWYNNRVAFFRDRAGPLTSKEHNLFFSELRKDKDKFEAFFKDRFHSPSNLEIGFQNKLSELKIPFEHNKWMAIKINELYERREIDLKVPIENTGKKFAIFIDGEAFHGANAVFKGTSVEKECEITKAFSSLGYLSIRYSETEVKNNQALEHFLSLYERFKNNPPSYYYRNCMTQEEIIK